MQPFLSPFFIIKSRGYRLLPDYLGAEDNEYNYQVMRLFMLGAVARIYKPGTKFDYCPILQGRQGIGKSTFLRILALDDAWFSDSLDSLDSDKAAQSLMGRWICELSELKSLARTSGGVESVKRFLSATQDVYRLPYERRNDVYPRQTVFAGTTNKIDFLTDEPMRRLIKIVIDTSSDFNGLFETIFLDSIRDCTEIIQEDEPAGNMDNNDIDDSNTGNNENQNSEYTDSDLNNDYSDFYTGI